MSLEDRGAQHDKVVVDKYHDPIANYEMSVRDYVMRPTATPGTGAITITLPPVAEAKGRFYSIICRQADAVNTITVEDNNDDSECWGGDIVLNAKCDQLLMYSDGLAWISVGQGPNSWPGSSTTRPPGTSQAPTTLPPTTLTTAVPTTTLTTVLQGT